MAGLGSQAHRALIERVVAHYRRDGRVRAIAVFGSVSAGTWHELSDVDLDIVTGDDVAVVPGREVEALFGSGAAVVVTGADCADVVLGSLEEISIRWHPLAATSPNICATVRVVHGRLTTAEVIAAGQANRAQPDERPLLDSLVRDAVGARKALDRGRRWEAAAGVERMRRSLLALRGQRDGLRLDPADPAGALAAVLAEAAARFDLGPRRRALLERAGMAGGAGRASDDRGAPARDTGGMVDDTARDRAIYQALKAADEVAAALQTHLIEEHGADPERSAPHSPSTNSLKLLRQARERLGQGLRSVEADHIAESDEISLRNQ